jgi:hypothetical protein
MDDRLAEKTIGIVRDQEIGERKASWSAELPA